MKKLAKKISKSVRAKIIISILSVLTVFFTVFSIFSNQLLFRVFVRETYKNLKDVATEVQDMTPGSAGYYFTVYSLASEKNVTIEIVEGVNLLIYTTANSSSALDPGSFSGSSNTRSAYSQMKDSKRYSNTFGYENFEIKSRSGPGTDYFIYSSVDDADHTTYVFSPVADVENVVAVAGTVFWAFTFILVIAMALVLTEITRRFTGPIVEMNKVTKQMAALNFEGKCKDYGRDEIGQLGESINTLSKSLDLTLEDLQVKNKQLEKDIELRMQLDNARRSFISNVSHELKTPIAIITGYAEGLCEGIITDPEMIKEYCSIINDEGQKMNSLVVELLELTKLESKSAPFVPEQFCIGIKIKALLNHLSLKFEQAKITVINSVPIDLMCYGQADKLEIVIKNYVTNAISHCGGDRIIKIDSTDMGSKYRINVFNTGEIIGENDIDEIWDSFYRADKAHGRQENRFGLGLSIVKSIMQHHDAEFGVKNEENGVSFYFDVYKDINAYDSRSK